MTLSPRQSQHSAQGWAMEREDGSKAKGIWETGGANEEEAESQRLLSLQMEMMKYRGRAEGGGQSWGGDGSTLVEPRATQSLDVRRRKSLQG